MVGIGARNGVRTIALITWMGQPLGREVGNANEIRESIDVLKGRGPDDVTELTMAFGEVMLELAGIDGGRTVLAEAISSGKALQKFMEVIESQGGDPSVIENPDLLPTCAHEAVVVADREGFVVRCDALAIGAAATRLGAGRDRKEDAIDPGVGITLEAKVGDRVAVGDSLARVRYNDQSRWQSHEKALTSAWTIEDSAPEPQPLVLERIDGA
jgi:pyrimidine-nucleoside phosphorylase